MAVGISVQMKSTLPLSTAMIMAGAVSAWVWMSAPGIWGRQESYQMVPVCAVQEPESWEMPVADARGLSFRVTQTMEA